MPYPANFKKSLHEHNVDESIIHQIFDGYEELEDKASKKIKFAFFARAMKQMDQLMDFDTRYEIIDCCACLKVGSGIKRLRN